MKEFEIWIEGYEVSGNRDGATFIGKATGETFKDACNNFRDENGWKLKLDQHCDYPSIWACRLFDNEIGARKSFG